MIDAGDVRVLLRYIDALRQAVEILAVEPEQWDAACEQSENRARVDNLGSVKWPPPWPPRAPWAAQGGKSVRRKTVERSGGA